MLALLSTEMMSEEDKQRHYDYLCVLNMGKMPSFEDFKNDIPKIGTRSEYHRFCKKRIKTK